MGGPGKVDGPICPFHPTVRQNGEEIRGKTIDECRCWERIYESERFIDPGLGDGRWGRVWLRVVPEGRSIAHASHGDRLAIAIQITERATVDDVRDAYSEARKWREALNRYQGRIGGDRLWEWLVSTGEGPARIRKWLEDSFVYYVRRELDLRRAEPSAPDVDEVRRALERDARALAEEALLGYPGLAQPGGESGVLPNDAPQPCLVANPSIAWGYRWEAMAHHLWESIDRGRPYYVSDEVQGSEAISTKRAIELVKENIENGREPLWGGWFPDYAKIKRALRTRTRLAASGSRFSKAGAP